MKKAKKKVNTEQRLKILFVCNGNVFRSYSAECLLQQYLKENKIPGWEVASAGVIANKSDVDPEVIAELKTLGIENDHHIQHKLDKAMLDKSDLVIVMAEDQINFMIEKFNYRKALLFNELAKGERSSIWDAEDEVINYRANRQGVEEKIYATIKYISDKIPALVEVIKKLKK